MNRNKVADPHGIVIEMLAILADLGIDKIRDLINKIYYMVIYQKPESYAFGIYKITDF